MEEQDFRVKLSSKKLVVDQINKYKELLRKSLDGQTGMSEESKQLLLQELLTNFETAVHDNVLINGQPWEDAPEDEEDECISLDHLLDENIVETTRKRRKYPQAILPHVIRTLKAERKLMGMYEQAMKPQEMTKNIVQEGIMSDLSAAAPGMFKQASSVLKSLQAVQQHAEGLRQVLNMRPTSASLEMLPPPIGGANGTRQPIKRVVEEAEARGCYIPPLKRPPVADGTPE